MFHLPVRQAGHPLKNNFIMMKKLVLFFFCFSCILFAQSIPEKPYPEKLVNDFAAFFSVAEQQALESKLRDFARNTTTQIVIVTVPSLDGYDVGDFTIRLAQKWGVGQKGKDNGVVLLIKPKTEHEAGKFFIATGYGLEEVIPDAIAKRIIEQEILPRFREGQHYKGVEAALDILMGLAEGKFTPQQYIEQSDPSWLTIFFTFLIIIFFVLLFSRISANRRKSIGHSLPFWTAMTMGSFIGRSSSGFRGFSSGGFGGFGGGGFGGGGSGGSW